MPVRFAGSNGKPYLSIGRYLADQGEIPTGQVSMQSIRQWLREHPELRDDLLRRNQRYIFSAKAGNLFRQHHVRPWAAWGRRSVRWSRWPWTARLSRSVRCLPSM